MAMIEAGRAHQAHTLEVVLGAGAEVGSSIKSSKLSSIASQTCCCSSACFTAILAGLACLRASVVVVERRAEARAGREVAVYCGVAGETARSSGRSACGAGVVARPTGRAGPIVVVVEVARAGIARVGSKGARRTAQANSRRTDVACGAFVTAALADAVASIKILCIWARAQPRRVDYLQSGRNASSAGGTCRAGVA